MILKEQLLQLIKAQDIVRQVYVCHNNTEIEKMLKQLDRQMTKIINMLGKNN